MDDEDAPPQLVEVSQLPESAPSTSEDTPEAQARVPITLVTGMMRAPQSVMHLYFPRVVGTNAKIETRRF